MLGSLLLLLPLMATAQIQHVQGPPVHNQSSQPQKQKPPKPNKPTAQKPPKQNPEFEGLTAEQIGQGAYDYYFGKNGKERNSDKALEWARQADKMGNNIGQYVISMDYRDDYGALDKDTVEYVKWLKKAAENGHPRAQYELGHLHHVGWYVKKDYAEAARWYRKPAEQGDEDAQCGLGQLYNGMLTTDYAEAFKWFRMAADQGDLYSLFKVADFYYEGKGVPQDYAEAIKIWTKRSSHYESQFKLGDCYYYGHGVKQDYAEAVKWYRKSAAQKIARAQWRLATCYYYGHGVEKNLDEAKSLLRMAAEKGDKVAKQRLKEWFGE